MIGPFDTFEQLAEAIGLQPQEAAAVWRATRHEAPEMGSLGFEERLGLERSDEERCAYPYAWCAAANVWD